MPRPPDPLSLAPLVLALPGLSTRERADLVLRLADADRARRRARRLARRWAASLPDRGAAR